MDFLQSKKSKEFLIFLFFAFLAFIFWMLQSLNEESETTFKIPVKFKNIPENAIITDPLPETIEVHLRDKGTALLNYMLNRIYPVEIDFNKYKSKDEIIAVRPSQIRAALNKQLLNTTELLSFSPDSIHLYYTLSAGKKVPVRIPKRLTTIPQCTSGKVIKDYDSVTVYAPAPLLKTIRYVQTDSLICSGLSDTTTVVLPVKKIKGAKIVPNEISVTVPVEEYTIKELKLPVRAIGFPDSMSLRTFPSTVNLSCFVAVSRFSEVKAGAFEVGVDYNQIRETLGKKLGIRIFEKPGFVTNIQIVPDSVEYILEEKENI